MTRIILKLLLLQYLHYVQWSLHASTTSPFQSLPNFSTLSPIISCLASQPRLYCICDHYIIYIGQCLSIFTYSIPPAVLWTFLPALLLYLDPSQRSSVSSLTSYLAISTTQHPVCRPCLLLPAHYLLAWGLIIKHHSFFQGFSPYSSIQIIIPNLSHPIL